MSEPQLVSTDPNYGAAPPMTGAHPEARMSAAAPGSTGLAQPMDTGAGSVKGGVPAMAGDTEAVTLGDLREDPIGSMKRIAASIGRDVSDPKLWLGMAASYFAPKMFSAAAPVVARAAAAVGRGAAAVEPSDIIGMVPRQVRTAATIAQKVGTAMRGAEPPTAAPSSAPPVEPVASGPVAPAPPVAAPPVQAAPANPPTAAPSPAASAPSPPAPVPEGPPAAVNTLPDQKALNEAALAVRRAAYQARMKSAPVEPVAATAAAPYVKPAPLTKAETLAFTDLLKRMPGAEAMKTILAQRDIAARFGTLSDADVASEIANRVGNRSPKR